MPWSGSFARCGLLATSWTVVFLLSTEMNFQRQTATEPNLDAESISTTSTTSTTVNTSNTTTTLPAPAAFTRAPRGVAVCIAGNLRTFTASNVFPQIRPFHEELWGWKISFFLYGTLEGAGPKNHTGHNLAAIHETNQTALKIALMSLRPEAMELVENAEDVTEENIAQYVLHQECFRNIQAIDSVDGVQAFFENRVRFLRGLNQLAHVISSLEMMMRFEKARGRSFEAVVLTRPDLRYDVNRSDHDWFRDVAWVPKWISNGNVALQMDHWVAMPRALAERFYLLGKVLSCSPSDQFCCRKIDRSESLWEYLTGAVHGNFGRCSCSNISTPYKKAKVAQIQRTSTK